MFFAGRTPKRGPTARNCKESARMAFLRTSPAAVRALVSGQIPATASGASRPADRDFRRLGLDLRGAPLALATLGFAVVGALPGAVEATALASASMHIVDFVWWNQTANREVTISTVQGAPADIYVTLGRGTDDMETGASLVIDGNPVSSGPNQKTFGRRDTESNLSMGRRLTWDLQQPPICASDDSGVCAALPNFEPIPIEDPFQFPFPGADYARGDADYVDFFADVIGSGSGERATVGLRSEVSLAAQPPAGGETSSGTARSVWDTGIQFDALRSFDSYFELTVQSQALARIEEPVGSATAETDFELLVTGRGGFFLEFLPSQLDNLRASQTEPGLSDVGTYNPTRIRLTDPFATGPDGIFRLNAATNFNLRLLASTTVEATLEPMAVSTPPSVWLLLSGIGGIMAFRWMSTPRVGSRARQVTG